VHSGGPRRQTHVSQLETPGQPQSMAAAPPLKEISSAHVVTRPLLASRCHNIYHDTAISPSRCALSVCHLEHLNPLSVICPLSAPRKPPRRDRARAAFTHPFRHQPALPAVQAVSSAAVLLPRLCAKFPHAYTRDDLASNMLQCCLRHLTAAFAFAEGEHMQPSARPCRACRACRACKVQTTTIALDGGVKISRGLPPLRNSSESEPMQTIVV
jgi:hypothetical protein